MIGLRELVIRLALGCSLVGSGTVLLPPTAWAEDHAFQGGKELYENCTNTDAKIHSVANMLCLGYIAGIADVFWVSNNDIDGRQVCIPHEATQGQAVDVTVRFLGAHPEKRHLAAAELVIQALAEAFPCK